jgi:hypothetical protein
MTNKSGGRLCDSRAMASPAYFGFVFTDDVHLASVTSLSLVLLIRHQGHCSEWRCESHAGPAESSACL